MSRIEEMIRELCPRGVKWDKLVNVAIVKYGFPFEAKLFTDDDSYIPVIRIRDVKPAKASILQALILLFDKIPSFIVQETT